jgi:chemotaxis protein MotB
MKKLQTLALCLLIAGLISGCVSKKKYDELMSEKVRLEADLSECDEQLEMAKSTLATYDARIERLKADTTALGERIRSTEGKLSALQSEYKTLDGYYKNLLTSSGRLNRDLAEQQERLLALRELNEKLSADLEEREKKVKELEKILENKEKAVQELRNRITNALLNFKENDLTVTVKNGKVYVSLAEQLLFKSGSVVVDPKGVTALQQLAVALKDQKDLHIMVEGHTDNVPISRVSQYMNDNWDLSVMRATSIVRILTKAGLSANQITAAGKAEFAPLGENSSPEGRSKNRRTEIIITPNLDELFKLLEVN